MIWRLLLLLLLSILLPGQPMAGPRRTPWTNSRVFGSPEAPANYRLTRAYPNLTFTNAVDLHFSTDLNRWFVAEQGGRILSFDPKASSVTIAADLANLQSKEGSTYSFTFDPGFASNRFIYICYALKPEIPDGTHVSRFRIIGEQRPTIDLQSEEIIITWLSGGHNGSCLKFGRDGMLYISTGDAAGPNPPDPLRTGQDISDLLSSVLRIDVRQKDREKNYKVPPDNPFVGNPKTRPEVWAYGFRNPWRMGFDDVTGELWVGDVGWELWELIYRVEKGGNYGWSIVEGRQPVLPNGSRGPTPILPPIKDHPHSEAASITGGIVYYGSKFPELRGAYVYGDWETGKIWGLKADTKGVVWAEELTDSAAKIITFASSPDGEIYVLDYAGGGIYTLGVNPERGSSQFPARLSETGLFSSVRKAEPAPGVYPFEVTVPMWRDYAIADRFVALPLESTITETERPWKYPTNSVLALTFTMEMECGNAASRRRLETQLLHFTGDNWGAYSYRWNADQSDAILVRPEGADEILEVLDSSRPGGVRKQPWRFHSRSECLRCHNPWCGTVLGFQPDQLGDRLTSFVELGLFSSPPKVEKASLVDPYAVQGDISRRARSYLHANCSHCHRENAGGSVPSAMNFDLPIEKAHLLGQRPVFGDLGLDHGTIVAPGEPFSSVLLFRASSTGRSRMPYLSSELVDERGVILLRDWIYSLSNEHLFQGKKGIELSPHNSTEALRLADALTMIDAGRRVSIARAAAASSNALFLELFDRFLPAQEQRTVIQTAVSRNEVLILHGNAGAGFRLLVETSRLTCMQCHIFKGHGRAFGPDLVQATKGKTNDQILDSILQPSRDILPEFVLYNLDTQDDEAISGMLIQKSDVEIVLRDATLIDHRIPIKSVRSFRASTVSAMPEGLIAGLSAQEVADLLEALRSDR